MLKVAAYFRILVEQSVWVVYWRGPSVVVIREKLPANLIGIIKIMEEQNAKFTVRY